MHDDPSGLNVSGPSIVMADQLVRLRTLRADQARQAALVATRRASATRHAVSEATGALHAHRTRWHEEETRHAERMRAGAMSSLALRDARARLDRLADEAVALQQALDQANTTMRQADADAAQARRTALQADRSRDQAGRLRADAQAARDGLEIAAEEAELEELVQMRHRPRDGLSECP
ncbi:YscO family type III secretion system apparatus protein [Tanticharoenia sakaeratensis]|uniref:Uncharacterized protein n=1 Tax=Tanticharoenia sakaeratensis NBRC 103193 TaxID=1231623 RepID=A0A0D6MMW3_9PROT|nr:YscO family type III secretion system apparatus protein [Tanticharoenia sakaeratensis]GAN55019.1 hypothetical protein Tasa_037_009 [Tanticharoenia sakaeratensis NBRC 103193]GBQ24552.1 hypothetical protein AA103193_2783 [Tanticharoenia sakaeratensis NBRC 103193]